MAELFQQPPNACRPLMLSSPGIRTASKKVWAIHLFTWHGREPTGVLDGDALAEDVLGT
jgi:hypothetical protein